MKDLPLSKLFKRLIIVITILVVTIVVIPPPVFIMSPGETKTTAQLLEHKPCLSHCIDKEQFFYTTVLLSPTNWGGVINAIFDQQKALMLKQQLLNGRTLDEYLVRAQLSMKMSAYDATIAAYNYLHIPYITKSNGIHILTKKSNWLSNDSFNDGEKIIGIKTKTGVYEAEDIAALLQLLNDNIEHSSEITFILEANGVQKEMMINVNDQLASPVTERDVINWLKIEQMLTLLEVEPVDESNRIQFITQNVGGGSAGLIISLSIISALNDSHIQTPYKIAATGAIDANGQVGIIGSIEHKVVSVSEAGIDLLIVPQSQLDIARKKAKSINSALHIVGVDTLEEAIREINSFQK